MKLDASDFIVFQVFARLKLAPNRRFSKRGDTSASLNQININVTSRRSSEMIFLNALSRVWTRQRAGSLARIAQDRFFGLAVHHGAATRLSQRDQKRQHNDIF